MLSQKKRSRINVVNIFKKLENCHEKIVKFFSMYLPRTEQELVVDSC